MAPLSALAGAALAVLHERPAHAYDILATLRGRLDDLVVKVRPGTLYHAIARMAEDGLVEEVGTERCGNRPERTTWAITDAGRAAFTAGLHEVIAEPRYEYPRFPAALAELSHLGRDDALAALRARREAMGLEAAMWESLLTAIAEREVPRVYWLDKAWLQASVAAELTWLEQTIAEIESGAIDWSERTAGCVPSPDPSLTSPLR